MSGIIDGTYMGEKTRIIYAVFTTPENAIGGNAICAFQMKVSIFQNHLRVPDEGKHFPEPFARSR